MKKTVTTENKLLESIDRLLDAARTGTAEQRNFFSVRKTEGLGVGLRNGKIMRQKRLTNCLP
ncbi:MAG: hypothetical protein COA41_19290 [Sphingopyxis sp.]|nr:MAG: hypothetical protein COA41_19290 [Sphingopyxis sp.]